MTPACAGLVAAVAWFCAFSVLQLLILRGGAGGSRSLSRALRVTIAGATVTALLLTLGQGVLPALIALAFALLAFACLFVLYVPALYTVLTSVSVQTLVLLRSRGGSLPEADLYARFAGPELFGERLATMAAAGHLAAEAARYRLTSRGRRVARPFAALKALWRLGPGG